MLSSTSVVLSDKQSLTHAPMLQIADLDKEFVVHIDACKRGLGGVLM